MEYFIGSFVTLLVIFVSAKILSSFNLKTNMFRPRVSQSHSFDLIAPYVMRFAMPHYAYGEPKETQSTNHDKSSRVKMVIYNNTAYWIHENHFYTADVVNGIVNKESTKLVDTMGMSTVQLKELSEIVEKLTEGTDNDSSNSGNKKF